MQKIVEFTKPRVAKWLAALESQNRGTITPSETEATLLDLQNFLNGLVTKEEKTPKKATSEKKEIVVPVNPNFYKHVKAALAEGRIKEEGKKGS